LDILGLQKYQRTDGTFAQHHFKWEISGDCSNPVYREMYGRPFRDRPQAAHNEARYAINPNTPKWLEVFARCRKCQNCMEQRARLWRGRILGELRLAEQEIRRTWFVTLTASPAMRWKYRMRATLKFNEGGKAPLANGGCADFEHLSQTERFGLIHSEISADLTLWLKRIRHLPVSKWRAVRRYRKQRFRESHSAAETMRYIREWEVENPCPRPARFSFVIVTEAHKKREVFPHYHVLITEHEGRLSEEDLRTQWRSRIGFAEAKLMRGPPEGALYLCKYLTKDSRARVRASIGYGQHNDATETPVRSSATDTGGERENRIAPLKTTNGLSEETAHPETKGEEENKSNGLSSGNRLSVRRERRLSEVATKFLSQKFPKNAHDAIWSAQGSASCTDALEAIQTTDHTRH